MLVAIKASLITAINTNVGMSDGKKDKTALHRNKIRDYLNTHNYNMNADVRKLCRTSLATVNWILIQSTADL